MTEQLRTIALVGHSGAGKTSLAEVMLFKAGVTTRLGRVEAGNTVMDFEPEEIKRNASLSSGFHQFLWKKHTINLIDTPGDQNFFSDTKSCMQAADGVIVVIDAVDGVKVQTEMAWEFAEEFNQPCMIFINKLDRERADFSKTVQDASERFTPKPIVVQLPIGREADFRGVVDLIGMKAYTYDENGKCTTGEIPSDMAEAAEKQREELIENVAESDDELIERYLDGEALSDEAITLALKKGVLARLFVPVLCGSATENKGIDVFMDTVVGCMPSPVDRGPKVGVDPAGGEEIQREPDPEAPFSAFVFKSITDPYAGKLSLFRVVSGALGSEGNFYNVNKETRERYNQLMSIAGKEQKTISEAGPGAIAAVAKLKETSTGDTLCDEAAKIKYRCTEPLPSLISFAMGSKSKGDEEKVYASLSKLQEEDPALKLTRNAETNQILLSGRGQVHIESTVEKLRRKFNVEVQLTLPKVPYKETVKKKVRAQGRHKKQTGGHGQFGDCWIDLEPLPRGQGFEFVDAVVGGVIPRTYIPAVEKGIVESARRGVLAGFPCIDFRVTLNDGSFHAVDSSEMAFKIAGSLAFRKAAAEANPVLLEPIMKVSVIASDEFMGDIMGDLNSRRGRVLGMDSRGKNQVINANVPMVEILSYAPDLNSMTGGRGMFTLEFSHYDEVPAQFSEKIIEEAAKNRE